VWDLLVSVCACECAFTCVCVCVCVVRICVWCVCNLLKKFFKGDESEEYNMCTSEHPQVLPAAIVYVP